MVDTPAQLPSLSIFFPCYNEEANVERMTRAALDVAQRVAADYEVLIVDDGSADDTGPIADRLAAESGGKVRAVHNRPNRGYGGALQRGFREARKDWIFYTDGDGQFDLADIVDLIPLLDRYDMVSAYRVGRQDNALRRLNAWGWGKVVGLVFGMRIRDVDCAFKIYPKSFIDNVELLSEGALIDAEMLARATRAGLRIGQVGVRHYPRTAGASTGGDPRVILRAFKELLTLRRRILRRS